MVSSGLAIPTPLSLPDCKVVCGRLQRYSDGSYRRIEAVVIANEEPNKKIGFP